MTAGTIGVEGWGTNAQEIVANIQNLERRGIAASWLHSGIGMDPITVYAAVAGRTERIKMGTAIVQTWPRHPVAIVQQTRALAELAPGRFRLGVGPSAPQRMEPKFGVEWKAPLGHLREYVSIVKTLLEQGQVEFEGQWYRANARLLAPVPGVPVMISALRTASFELAGEVADGAITWVCPGLYLRDVAVPAILRGATKAGRETPPLIAHAPVCVHDDADEVREATRQQLDPYPRLPFYAQMFADAGFPEVQGNRAWSNAAIEAVVLSGDEKRVAGRLRELFTWGASEVMATVLPAGADPDASRQRTLGLLSELSSGTGGP